MSSINNVHGDVNKIFKGPIEVYWNEKNSHLANLPNLAKH